MEEAKNFKRSLKKFRDYGFDKEFMSDEEFKAKVFNSRKWEFKGEETYFHCSEFQIAK